VYVCLFGEACSLTTCNAQGERLCTGTAQLLGEQELADEESRVEMYECQCYYGDIGKSVLYKMDDIVYKNDHYIESIRSYLIVLCHYNI